MMLRLIQAVLALMLLAAPVAAQPFAITGEVFYRERIALPGNATLHVGLVALPGGHPVVGAGASLPARGQVPIGFTLNIRTSVAGPVGLVAEIKSAGRTLFRTPAPVPVDLARPAPVRLMLVQSRGDASDGTLPTPDAALIDTLWRVTSIGARPASGERPLTLSIAADLRAGGNGGCNNFFTEASFDGDGLRFGPAAATRMACAQEIMAQETAYLAALAATTGFELNDKSLRLLDAAGVPLIGLVPMEQ